MVKVHGKELEEMEYKGIKLIPNEFKSSVGMGAGYEFTVLGKEYVACDRVVGDISYEKFMDNCFKACKLRIDRELLTKLKDSAEERRS